MPVETHTVDERLEQLRSFIAITNDGDVAVLRSLGNTEQLVVGCLVAQKLACEAGKTKKRSLSVDELTAAGGLAQRVARQTLYNCLSQLSKARVIQKNGNEFLVDERAVLQFFSAILPKLNSDGGAHER